MMFGVIIKYLFVPGMSSDIYIQIDPNEYDDDVIAT